MSAVGGVARAGRRRWGGVGSVCWACRAGWACGAPIPSSWNPGSGHTRLLAVLHAGLAPLVSSPSCVPSPRSAGPSPGPARPRVRLPRGPPQSLPRATLAARRPRGTRGRGAERSRASRVAGRRAEDITCVSGLAAARAGARGRCHSLRSRGELESASQSQQPSRGWPNAQPVFFSFETEPPSPDSRATG